MCCAVSAVLSGVGLPFFGSPSLLSALSNHNHLHCALGKCSKLQPNVTIAYSCGLVVIVIDLLLCYQYILSGVGLPAVAGSSSLQHHLAAFCKLLFSIIQGVK
jgi:hypothetical protein